MEHAQDLMLPAMEAVASAAEAAEAGVTTALLAGVAVAAGGSRRHPIADLFREHQNKLAAFLTLLPIIDLFADLSAFNQLSISGHSFAATVVFVILFFNWRFTSIYAALTPVPTYVNISAMYVPFFALPSFSRLMGSAIGITEMELQKLYDHERAHAPKAALAPRRGSRRASSTIQTETLMRSLYGHEPGRLRRYLLAQHEIYLKQKGFVRKFCFVILLEAQLTLFSLVLGPFFLWRAALTLALETLDPDDALNGTPAADEASKHVLYLRVLTFIEAAYEALPQLLVQTYTFIFEPGSIAPFVFFFSALCSLGGVFMAVYHFVKNQKSIMELLRPSPEALLTQVEALMGAAQVDVGQLFSAIMAARDDGVLLDQMTDAIGALREARLEMARTWAGGLQELKDQGFIATELLAIGYVASDLRDVGFSVSQLRSGGVSTSGLRSAGFSAAACKAAGCDAVELRSAGYGPDDLRAAGFSIKELYDACYPLNEMLSSGLSIAEIHEQGVPITQFVDEGVPTAHLADHFPVKQLLDAGVPFDDARSCYERNMWDQHSRDLDAPQANLTCRKVYAGTMITAMAASSKESHVVVADQVGVVSMIQHELDATHQRHFIKESFISAVALNPANDTAAVGGLRGGVVSLYKPATDADTFEMRRTHEEDIVFFGDDSVSSLLWANDSQLLCTSLSRGQCSLWDVSKRTCVAEFSTNQSDNSSVWTHHNMIMSSTFVGFTFLACSSHGGMGLWDVRAPQKAVMHVANKSCGGSGLNACTLSAYGNLIAAGGRDGKAYLFDVRTGRCLAEYRRKGALRNTQASSMVLSHTSRELVVGYSDGSISLWDVAESNSVSPTTQVADAHRQSTPNTSWFRGGADVAELQNTKPATVKCLCLGGDGSFISGGFDGLVKIWSPSRGNGTIRVDERSPQLTSVQAMADAAVRTAVREAHAAKRDVYRMLLLGAGESGKSTIFKQMKVIKRGGYSKKDSMEFIGMVHSNTLDSIDALLGNLSRFGVAISDDLAKLIGDFRARRETPGGRLDATFGQLIQRLWQQEATQEVFKRRAEFQLNDAAEFYLENIERIASPNYVPTQDDILRGKNQNTGILQSDFAIKNVEFTAFDVGASLSEYDQVLFEDETRNRMDEALALFNQIVNSQYFRAKAFLLFLNKKDLFEKKLKTAPLADYLPDCYLSRSATLDESVEFIKERFLAKDRNAGRKIKVTATTAIDTGNVKFMLNSVLTSKKKRAIKMAASGASNKKNQSSSEQNSDAEWSSGSNSAS